MPRLAVARLWHEGNSFAPLPTGAAAFRQREWAVGEAVPARYRGTATEMGALLDFLAERPGWSARFLRCAAAPPGGPLEQPLFDALLTEIAEGLAAERWDGVYLSLHGACLATEEPEPDLRLIEAARRAVGRTPLAVTFDLHANLSPRVGPLVDVLVGYKTYPHVDMRETAAKALALLEAAVEGRSRPCVRVVKAGCLLGSFAMRTEAGPMAEVEALCRELEARPGVLDVTPFGGFAYADTPSAGAAAAATVEGEPALAEQAAAAAAAALFERRAAFSVRLPGAETAMAEALAAPGPVAVLEPADNPLSGGAADTPGLFRALLAMRPPGPAAFAFFWDPGAVAAARAAGVGAWLSLSLGARLSSSYGAPVPVEARVLRLTEGRFVNEGPMERGLAVDQGPTAVLDVAGVAVVVTSACQAANDPAWFRLHGLEPERLRLLCVKGKNHFRAAFASRFARLIDCDTPGPAGSDLSPLPFRRLPPGLRPA